ncbi:hypothetical protein [Microvirga antarctica]|uniref:hypothetical protein n=1 Tax=Microvirga antarctica TaxID=2819233 RepID=UPI001B3117BF|nr:hypothetical protein [Microvirga antarctica]
MIDLIPSGATEIDAVPGKGHCAPARCQLETKIQRMREMAGMLHGLANACEGGDRPECPIMKGLGGQSC